MIITLILSILGLLLLGVVIGGGARIISDAAKSFWFYRKPCLPIAAFWLLLWSPFLFIAEMRGAYFIVAFLGLFVTACFARAIFLKKHPIR